MGMGDATNAYFWNYESGNIQFATSGSARLTIDSSGRMLVGAASASLTNKFLLQGNTSNANNGGYMRLQTANSIVAGTSLGAIGFGDSAYNGALIEATGDGSWSPFTKASRLEFSTTPNGATSPTVKMRIDNSGDVGIGNDASFPIFTDDRSLLLGAGSGSVGFQIYSSTTGYGGIYFGDTDSGAARYRGYVEYKHNDDWLRFAVAGAERMRVTSAGYLCVNRTDHVHGGQFSLDYTNGVTAGIALKDTQTTGTGVPMQIVNGAGSVVGSITQNQSSTSFNTSSDYRLKENVIDIADGITRVKQLQPKRFNFIADADTIVDGFLAHEAQTVVPEAVTGTHNEVDEDGNAVMQGIDQSKLVPLLTAALQEAIAKIETLESEVAALKAS